MDYHFDKDKEVKKDNKIYYLLSLIIVGLLIVIVLQKNNYNNIYQKNIDDNLFSANLNKRLINANDKIMLELESSQQKINYMDSINNDLINKIDKQQVILNNIKLKYGKANNRSRNFNADSIHRYFSNIESE